MSDGILSINRDSYPFSLLSSLLSSRTSNGHAAADTEQQNFQRFCETGYCNVHTPPRFHTEVGSTMFRFLSKVLPSPCTSALRQIPKPSPLEVGFQRHFESIRAQEARARYETLDNNDIGYDPASFDVSITDVTDETMKTTIAEETGIQYLSNASKADARIKGQVGESYLHGPNRRAIIPLVVSHAGSARWVFSF
jgi:hypothetical protein